MKHFIKKKILQGAGKGSKPKAKPAVLRPPIISNFEVLNSYSVAEVVDLISDGPIEGLVNQNGQKLGNSLSILQGVYLDNTPIEVTNSQTASLKNDGLVSSVEIQASGLNDFGSIYYENNKYKTYNHYTARSLNFFSNIFISKFPKVDESRLFISNYNFNNKSISTYSPINGGDIGYSNGEWQWNGSLADNNKPSYFSNVSGSVEIHYENLSLFASGTILNTTELDINAKLQNASEIQRKLLEKAKNNLNSFKSERKDITKRLSFDDDGEAFVVIKIGSASNPSVMKFQEKVLAYSLSDKTQLIDMFFTIEGFEDSFQSSDIIDILTPTLNDDLYLNKLFGCIILRVSTSIKKVRYEDEFYRGYHNKIFLNNILPFANPKIELRLYKGKEPENFSKASKYNFLNVACEFKDGDEYQSPLNHFKNIYVDYDYNSELFGPFRAGKRVQRVQGLQTGPSNPNINISLNDAITQSLEGSDDIRNEWNPDYATNYSDWNAVNSQDEESSTITHTVENPNVNLIYFTLGISALSDTVEIDKKAGQFLNNSKITAGSKIPSIVNIKVETGKITNGEITQVSKQIKIFSIVALIEGQMLIDFGTPDLDESEVYKSVTQFISDNEKQNKSKLRFELPGLLTSEDPTSTKRYVKVTKLSAETNSVLISKDISLVKVTEIIENKLSYPFSSLIGIKLDARSFSSVPERSYDCRLKRVKIPNNYNPLKYDGTDQRYIKKSSDYNQQNQIYVGDWDGEFKTSWTDNPAWIIYDLLTSQRYGLGSYIDESQINKWELYKIAQFCDAVDENGFFIGVSDGVGGLEPRYSCNIVFREQTKIFDAINIVANLFRGVVFFSNSEIHFLDDRPRLPISLFTNSNVKEGAFNYTNTSRDQQFNTVEVAYLDRFDNYQSKIEYVQDEADIRKRGILKTTINTQGVTSRAMARRIGQHIIYQTIKENQTVEFTAGLESLLCRPGDLVVVEDEMKTRSSNFGRILEIDKNLKSLTLDNAFVSGSMNNTITVYTPTGYLTNEDLNDLSALKRSRVEYFNVARDLLAPQDSILTGNYYFSGYINGFNRETKPDLNEQYPVYTGLASGGHSLYCYYNTGATGFVFATGRAFENNNLYDKVITNTGVLNILDIQSSSSGNQIALNYKAFRYDSAASNKRGAVTGEISGALNFDQSEAYNGVLISEVQEANQSQITKFNLTGYDNNDFGSKVYINNNDINANLISFIALGSPYRLERTNASDQIYKIISIRELNQNEYSVVATKYNTGKFVEIEQFTAEDFGADTYYSGPMTINNIDVNQIATPTINTFAAINTTATGFGLSGSWSSAAGTTGTKVEIYNSISNEYYVDSVSSNFYNLNGLSTLGQWKLQITSLGNNSSYLNSPSIETGAFVAYSSLTILSKPAVTQFTLL